MRWRRLCVDVDDDGQVIGGSIEHYRDTQLDPNCTVVFARQVWFGRSPIELVVAELDLGWPQPELPFVYHPAPPSR